MEKAKHTSDILAGIGQLSYEDYTRAAQQAKASLIDFQQRQPPRMALLIGAMSVAADLVSEPPCMPMQERSIRQIQQQP